MGKPPKRNDALQVSPTSINERDALLAKVMVVDRVFLHPWRILPMLAMASSTVLAMRGAFKIADHYMGRHQPFKPLLGDGVLNVKQVLSDFLIVWHGLALG